MLDLPSWNELELLKADDLGVDRRVGDGDAGNMHILARELHLGSREHFSYMDTVSLGYGGSVNDESQSFVDSDENTISIALF